MEELIQENNEQVAWSMDEQRLKQINSLLVEADDYFKKGYYNDALSVLKTVKINFIHSCNKEEFKELETMETNMNLCEQAGMLVINKDRTDGNGWENNSDVSNKQEELFNKIIKLNYGKLKQRVEKYYCKIMELLDSYGYIAKKKKDKTDMNY